MAERTRLDASYVTEATLKTMWDTFVQGIGYKPAQNIIHMSAKLGNNEKRDRVYTDPLPQNPTHEQIMNGLRMAFEHQAMIEVDRFERQRPLTVSEARQRIGYVKVDGRGTKMPKIGMDGQVVQVASNVHVAQPQVARFDFEQKVDPTQLNTEMPLIAELDSVYDSIAVVMNKHTEVVSKFNAKRQKLVDDFQKVQEEHNKEVAKLEEDHKAALDKMLAESKSIFAKKQGLEQAITSDLLLDPDRYKKPVVAGEDPGEAVAVEGSGDHAEEGHNDEPHPDHPNETRRQRQAREKREREEAGAQQNKA